MGAAYSQDLRDRIIRAYQRGMHRDNRPHEHPPEEDIQCPNEQAVAA